MRCAPPANKPTPTERDTCAPFLVRELGLLTEVRVVVALGAFGWDAALRAFAATGHEVRPRPRFGHGAEVRVGPYTLLGSYHPSQQNTFTGRLTEPMLNRVEAVIRCYDPCLSCSTHALGEMALHVQLIGPDGAVLDEIRR